MPQGDAPGDASSSRDAASDSRPISWWHLASLLVVISVVLSLSSLTYEHGKGYEQRPIAPMVVLLLTAGAVYIVSLRQSLRRPPGLGLAVGVSILTRVILLPSAPIQEDDIYRYLWDGRVLAAGVNPYLFSPADIEAFAVSADDVDASSEDSGTLGRLARLARASDAVATGFERINNRHFATIYPPVAQGVFWCFGALVPISWPIEAQLTAMKTALLAFDLGTIALVVALLRRVGKDPGLVVMYGWSPLVLKELSNSGHMDAIPTLFLAAAVLALFGRRAVLTGLLLGAAVSAKIYAILALPLFLRWLGPRRGAVFLLAVAGVVAASHYAMGEGRSRYRETLFSFAVLWENHDAVFMWVQRVAAVFVGRDATISLTWGPLEESVSLSYACAMVVFCALMAGVVLWSTLRLTDETPREEIVRRIFLLLAALFLLGPLGFPWYFVPCMPFLPFVKLRSWWILPCLLPTYYLRFWFDYHYEQGFAGFTSGAAFFDHVIVSVELGLFFAVAAAEILSRRRLRVPR